MTKTLPRLLGLAVLAATLAVTPSAQAKTKKPKPKPPATRPGTLPEARFMASFEGTRTVKWNLPFYVTTSDCSYDYYTYGNGEETWQVKAKPQPIMFIGGSRPKDTLLLVKYTFDRTEPDKLPGIRASGHVKRSSFTAYGGRPRGTCGSGEAFTRDQPKQDCGERLPGHIVSLGAASNNEIRGSLLADPSRRVPTFEKCPLNLPRGVDERSWAQLVGKLSVADIFGKKQSITVTNKTQKWADDFPKSPGVGLLSTSATLTWTLTLTRVR